MAASRTAIYADMLSLQTRLQFPFERHFYALPGWSEAQTVLDFGCGNAAYASLLDDRFPGKQFFCVEADAGMREVASRQAKPNLHIVGDLREIPADVVFDFALLRLVLLHVSDRQAVYRFIADRSRAKAAILIFDADDDRLAFDPEPCQFVTALRALRAQSKNRVLKPLLPAELEQHGFHLRYEDSIVVNNSFPHAGEDLFKYMYRTAELGVGSPLPEALHRELIEWWMADPYVQYGFFGQMYERS